MAETTTSVERRRPFLHPLAGSLPGPLTRTLRAHGGCALWHVPQVAFALMSGILRWPFCAAETLRVSRRVRHFSCDPPPIFIVGHWRSGTTFLHNLMSRDPAFCFPTVTDVLRPFDFYPSPFEFISRKLLTAGLPPTRPMDDVPLQPGLPQEDEIALATMGATSFFNCFYFPQQLGSIFAREVLFEQLPEAEFDRWRECLWWYLAKLAMLFPGRRLLLKNPAHGPRIPHVRALFPGAKFIHIHRDPHDVVASTRKLYHRMLPVVALQDYDGAEIDRHIIRSYPEFMDRLLANIAELPAPVVVDVRYVDLVRDPIATLKAIYEHLGLDDFARARGAISAFAEQQERRPPPAVDADREFAGRHGAMLAPYRTLLGYPTA